MNTNILILTLLNILINILDVLLVILPILLSVAFMTIIERKQLAAHQRRVGPVQVNVPCNICDACFGEQQELERHLVDKHAYWMMGSYCDDFECTPRLSHNSGGTSKANSLKSCATMDLPSLFFHLFTCLFDVIVIQHVICSRRTTSHPPHAVTVSRSNS